MQLIRINNHVVRIRWENKPESGVFSVSPHISIRVTDHKVTAYRGDSVLLDELKAQVAGGTCVISMCTGAEVIYGLGERFDQINQIGLTRDISVVEKFTRQGASSYCPIPFFMTNTGFGLYVDEERVVNFAFHEGTIRIEIKSEASTEIVLFFGTPSEIVSAFSKLTGTVALPPKWAFGPWMSTHRWNSRKLVEEQLVEAEKSGMPYNVVVLEAWSDESTFYLWNESCYDVKQGNECFCYDEIFSDESSAWYHPKEMIEQIHAKGLKVILWQAPVMKRNGNQQQQEDCRYLEEMKMVVANADGTPYIIPEGYWFNGSMIPDFTNPETRRWWCDKRRYLLDIGVDGFKSDGGEFIHRPDLMFHDGRSGKEMKNAYVKEYLETFSDFIGPDRVLFSRAGFTGQHRWPMHWAGDQLSTWDEFRAVFVAGISAGLSGIPFWSYDIAGFAGPMPDIELYERATQMAVFTPGMQWHSEPVFGQFAEFLPSSGGKNDRSPWCMAEIYQDKTLVERLRFHYDLKMNLMPYLFSEALNSKETGLPMMKHLCLVYPEDRDAQFCEDAFLLGDLLVAPILWENCTGRDVYFPEGMWMDVWSRTLIEGGAKRHFPVCSDRIPVFLRMGGGLALNLGSSGLLGSSVGNRMDLYSDLVFVLTGTQGFYRFRDDLGNHLTFDWHDGVLKEERISGFASYRLLSALP